MLIQKNEKSEKRSFSAFDVLLVLLFALAVSLAVYFLLETPYGVSVGEKPVYRLTMQAKLSDWEEDAVPAERQRLLDESGAPAGRVIDVSVTRDGFDRTLLLTCEWEGDLPEGMAFRLETADLVKVMHITDIAVVTEDKT